jgi:hypothetical protein
MGSIISVVRLWLLLTTLGAVWLVAAVSSDVREGFACYDSVMAAILESKTERSLSPKNVQAQHTRSTRSSGNTAQQAIYAPGSAETDGVRSGGMTAEDESSYGQILFKDLSESLDKIIYAFSPMAKKRKAQSVRPCMQGPPYSVPETPGLPSPAHPGRSIPETDVASKQPERNKDVAGHHLKPPRSVVEILNRGGFPVHSTTGRAEDKAAYDAHSAPISPQIAPPPYAASHMEDSPRKPHAAVRSSTQDVGVKGIRGVSGHLRRMAAAKGLAPGGEDLEVSGNTTRSRSPTDLPALEWPYSSLQMQILHSTSRGYQEAKRLLLGKETDSEHDTSTSESSGSNDDKDADQEATAQPAGALGEGSEDADVVGISQGLPGAPAPVLTSGREDDRVGEMCTAPHRHPAPAAQIPRPEKAASTLAPAMPHAPLPVAVREVSVAVVEEAQAVGEEASEEASDAGSLLARDGEEAIDTASPSIVKSEHTHRWLLDSPLSLRAALTTPHASALSSKVGLGRWLTRSTSVWELQDGKNATVKSYPCPNDIGNRRVSARVARVPSGGTLASEGADPDRATLDKPSASTTVAADINPKLALASALGADLVSPNAPPSTTFTHALAAHVLTVPTAPKRAEMGGGVVDQSIFGTLVSNFVARAASRPLVRMLSSVGIGLLCGLGVLAAIRALVVWLIVRDVFYVTHSPVRLSAGERLLDYPLSVFQALLHFEYF